MSFRDRAGSIELHEARVTLMASNAIDFALGHPSTTTLSCASTHLSALKRLSLVEHRAFIASWRLSFIAQVPCAVKVVNCYVISQVHFLKYSSLDCSM